MSDLLPFIIAGLASGSVYGLAGVGLVLTYKTSGVFNFAHGSLATVAAFLFYTLHVEHGVSWGVSAAISVLVAGPLLGVVLERFGRVLSQASLTTQVVGTVGILLIVEASVLILFGSQAVRAVPVYLPTRTVKLVGTPVTVASIIVFALSAVLATLLYLYFRHTRSGVAMRAVVDNPDLLDIAGTSPVRVRRMAWIIGVTFVSLSGVLLAPLLADIDSSDLTLLVVTAFGAAAIGAFSSIPLTYMGGIILGIGAALATKYFKTGFLGGLPPTLPFLVLFGYLIVMPRRRVSNSTRLVPSYVRPRRVAWPIQGAGAAAVLVLLVFVPSFAGVHIDAWMGMLTLTILFLSLGLLVRSSGQVSLCHVGFLAIGACAFSHLTTGPHIPWFPALMLSGLVAVPIGAVLAIPAIRLTGLYLALATLGFGILLSNLFYTEGYMFGATGLGVTIPRPKLSWLSMQSDRQYYYLLLVATILVVILVVALTTGRLGRLLVAMSSSPTGLASTGLSVDVTRVVVFCLSAFLAAIAGALDGGVVGVVSASSYAPLLSVTYFALIIIAVGSVPWYALIGAAGVSLIPSYWTSGNAANYLTLVFGVAAVAAAMKPLRAPTKESGFETPKVTTSAVDQLDERTRSVTSKPSRITTAELELDGVRVAFGGLVAVDTVSLVAPANRITGLIGPNGAGKTTIFNACTGLVQPRHGSVQLNGKLLARHGPAWRARSGLGRTFQQIELFDGMTVEQNVRLGREGGVAGANPLRHLAGGRRQAREVAAAATEALGLCGIAHLADLPVQELSTGQRRLVELARCLAGSFGLLLLDEPSSGLDPRETAAFGVILQAIVRDRGIGILLVEHDMVLVNSVCEYIYVLDFGRLICSGSSADVLSSPIVRDVYLGNPDSSLAEREVPDEHFDESLR